MKIGYMGKRAVSLVLALELLLSPVAMARAADPARIFDDEPLPAIPVGEEAQGQTPSDVPGGGQVEDRAKVLEGDPIPFSAVKLLSNLSVHTDYTVELNNDSLWGYDIFYKFRLNSADRMLNVEVTDDMMDLMGSLWLSFNDARAKDAGRDSAGGQYTYLPPLLDDYRVPDMEFSGDVEGHSGYYLAAVGEGGAVERVRPLGQDGTEELLDEEPGDITWDSTQSKTGQLVKFLSGYDTVVGTPGNEFATNYLPLASWFLPSRKAMVTALGITAHGDIVTDTTLTQVYTKDPLGEEPPGAQDTMELTDFSRPNQVGDPTGTELEHREMWIQVGRDQTSLDLHFQTYEPYYSYTRDAGPGEETRCPVAVSYSLDGGPSLPMELTLGETGNLACTFLPRPETVDGITTGTNTPADKARGDWNVTGIPLTGGEGSSPRTVDVTLTVTAPDGETQTTYVIHVQRRQNTAQKGWLANGNTPFGMIERDNSDKWNAEITKDRAKELFQENNMSFADVATRPTGQVNQNGGIYRGMYTNCWPASGGNVDRNSVAIAAYQDMCFQDPGVAFTDSFGREVDLENALYAGTVKRTIQLKRPKDGVLSAASWSLADALTEDCWYTVTDGKATLTADPDKASQILTSLTQEVDLRGLIVLPGIYEIRYDYQDPATDATTPVTGGKPTYTDTLYRKLVVLPIPGDVDMDGAVTTADAYALKNYLSQWSGSDSERVRLGIGRVFDTNGNGRLEAEDYQRILNGFQPEQLRSGPESDYFYLPLPAGVTGYQRKTWDLVENDGAGTLKLEFLGVETGTRSGEFTVSPGGPFETKTGTDGELTPVSLKDQATGEDNSVFWMGVKLENSPLKGSYINDFTISLTYDSRYVEPAQVYTSQDKSSYAQGGAVNTFDGWSYTLRKYNLRATAADDVIWKGGIEAYSESDSTAERSYQTHYSKVVGEMEQDRGASPLREMVVTLHYLEETGKAHAQVKDGYLLVAPFKLKSHPPREFSSQARLIELNAGMRDLTLVTTPPKASFLATLFGLERAVEGEITSAFSAQDEIYGNSTQNLRDGLRYDLDEGTVPIGKDNTARTVLETATYGVPYERNTVGGGNALTAEEIKNLPPGLTYDAGQHKLFGTPLLPGLYQFTVNQNLYELTVEEKIIHYRPQDASSYYGEAEYRGSVADREGTTQRNFTFVYNAADLCAADRLYAQRRGIMVGDGSKDEWRDGKELEIILNRQVDDPYVQDEAGTYIKHTYTHTAPTFTAAVDTRGTPVRVNTPVGDYVIDTTNGATSNCYSFSQTETAQLTVVRRPVFVDHIIASAEDSGLSIYNDEQVGFSNRVLYDKGDSTQIILTLPPMDEDGLYNRRPLTGDAKVGDDLLGITYSGEFLHDPSKGDTNISFQLSAQQEPRQIRAQRVSLRNSVTVDGAQILLQSGNYTLADPNVRHENGDDDIQGTVILRGVAKMEMTDFPLEFAAGKINYYGSKIENPDMLMVRAELGEGSSSTLVGKYAYNSPDLFPLLIHYNWVTPEEYEAGTAPGEETSLVGTGVDMTTGLDTRPYGFSREKDPDDRKEGGYRDNYLYPDMNGWRICACVTQYAGSEEAGQGVQYIKCYSEPITVKPRTLTITAKSATRYYGEDLPAGQPDYTFSYSRLAPQDYEGVIRGTSAELEMVFARLDERLEGFGVSGRHTLPEFRMEDDRGEPVDKYTDVVAGKTYRIVVYGAYSLCYDIQYTVNDGKETSLSPEEGAAPLTILPRPIIVKNVVGNGDDGSFTSIYADTKNLVVTKDPQSGEQLEALGEHPVLHKPKAEFMLPRFDPARGTTSYYNAISDGNEYTEYGCTFPAGTTNALVAGDEVGVRYQVRFLPDPKRYTWSEFTQGFFDNDPIAAAPGGCLPKQVQVEKMELVGADSGNYLMVFNDALSRIDRVPADAVEEANQVSAPANNNQAVDKPYYVSGTGQVYLRPIKNIVITSLGDMTYIYGDQFAPDQPGTSGNVMTVRVEYDRKYDNDPEHNFNTEEVEYRHLRVDDDGKRVSTFAARGFTVYYVKPGQTPGDAEANGQTLVNGDPMKPGEHNGATLFVTGLRSAGDPLVYSTYDDEQPEEPIRVDKATLTLTAANAHKFYGEANPEGDYTFTFDTRDLVQIDRDKLGAVPREGTADTLRALDANADLSRLSYSTNATTQSTVGLNGKWGEYDLRLSVNDPTKVLSNYDVVTQNAHLYVYPRPVRVTGINSSASDPVFTIFNDPTTPNYQTEFSTAGRGALQPRLTVGCGSPTNVFTVNAIDSADGRPHTLPITRSMGLVGTDDLIFKAQVGFPDNSEWRLTGADVSLGVRVRIDSMVGTTISRNYILRMGEEERFFGDLETTPGAGSVWGSAKLRTIESIDITRAPINGRLEYTYGETLDLTGLQVRITYAKMEGEGEIPADTVDYIGPDQFKSMGLYVNYWTPGDSLPESNAQRRSLPTDYFEAATGDHLTIAPTHDTQQYIGRHGATPTQVDFAANGKYLVISGFQKAVAGNAATQIAAEPKILGEWSGVSDYYEGAPIPVKVNPLKLRYSLRAEDKTYDGNTRTAGAVTLTNLYGSGPAADAVYIPLGASYESASMDHSDFMALKQNVVDGRVTFSTGTYIPNGEAPMLTNGRTDWAAGYTWGRGLTFTFPNANVHYVDDSGVSGVGTQEQAAYWKASQTHNDVTDQWDSYRPVTAMPVEVTNMVLAGPDAANYTWDWDSDWTWDAGNSHRVAETQVLITTRAMAEEDQAAAPFATVHKANRAPIQDLAGYAGRPAQLMVDRATNVVRLLLEQKLADLADNNNAAGTKDEFRDELHFEYALLYEGADEDGIGTGLLAQWAGPDGQKDYQDTVFFGGETVTPTVTAAGYQPALDRLPKIDTRNENTVYKGQVYQWAGEDTGLSDRGYREDSGFVLDPASYPGGAVLVDRDGNPVPAEEAYWYYTLYTTNRRNLPRDTVFYPLVRLAETHNYNASGNLSGDAAVTAQLLDEAQKALAALEQSDTPENLQAAREASQAVLTAARGMESDARRAAKAQTDFDWEVGESNRWPEEQPAPYVGPASAIKTLKQRLDLTSASTERSQDNSDTTEYLVEMLEAVWFTDTLVYEEEKFLSAAVYNHPTRYFGYFWDSNMSAKVEFNETALNFTEELLIPVQIRQEDGSTLDVTLTVNAVDERVGGRVAKLYVKITNDTGNKVRLIQILPTALYARLGDAPFQLSLATDPVKPSNRVYQWISSDPNVVTVDENGLVTFRGVGKCTITVLTDNRKSSTIAVTVSEVLPLVQAAQSVLDLHHKDAWMELDEEGNFYPQMTMTRAQAVELLDLFLDPSGSWAATDEMAYLDVTGEEKYADALRRMTGAGVVVGLPGSIFGGGQEITRAEFTAMVTRMLRLDAPDTKGKPHRFADAGENDTWAYRYIDALAQTGVVRGTGGENYSPSRLITREEVAVILARLLTVKLDTAQAGLKRPADMTPENWSYESVLQAINTILFPEPVVLPPAEDA